MRFLVEQLLVNQQVLFDPFFGSEYDYGFSLEPPQLDTLTCEGNILLYILGKDLPNSIFEKVFPAQFGLKYRLPSLCQWDPNQISSALMEISELRFNALCPTRFLEVMGIGMNQSLVQEVHSDWEVDHILEKLDQLKANVDRKGEEFLALSEIEPNSAEELEKLFHDAFTIRNKLILLARIFVDQIEELRKVTEVDTKLKAILKTLQKIYRKLQKQKSSSPPLKRLKTQINCWFPDI
jgi:hypothetical protein